MFFEIIGDEHMDIAVVGGGLFGVHSAITLAKGGFRVTLFEKQDRIMTAASKINQWRLHRGYHYPRSRSTSRACRDSERIFRKVYEPAIVEEDEHFYCIASEKTKTSPDAFLHHCQELGLAYTECDLDLVRHDRVDLCLRVPEDRINPQILREMCQKHLKEEGVRVQLNHRVDSLDELEDYDYIVVALYAHGNTLLQSHPSLKRTYKFELCEKPVVELPEAFRGKSIVIMDGPFMCVDPYREGDRFLLGNVIHAIHDTQVGLVPDMDEKYEPLLNRDLIEDPPLTKIERFKEHGAQYIPGLSDARHVGSYFTLRTVLPNKEKTDARPTIVNREENVFQVFSGKLSTCVQSANRISELISADVSDSELS